MSARPDLTTEEQGHGEAMVRLGAKMNRASRSEPWQASPLTVAETRELFGIIADLSLRLRSERPAVTPEMVRAMWLKFGCCDGGDQCASSRGPGEEHMEECCESHYREMLEYSRAALSVSSTEGKP